MKKSLLLVALALLIFVGTGVYFLSPLGCSPVPEITPTMGSQGFRTWSGPTLLSFEHAGGKVCVPTGMAPLGFPTRGFGFAIFEKGVTGIMYVPDAFTEKSISFVNSAYEVRMLIPKSVSETRVELYEATTRNAFERIGLLFNDSKENKKREHIILVTPEVERTDGKTDPIYPDPRESVSVYVQPPESARGEELLIHAVAHLYNRQREDLTEYQKNQEPLPLGDFQELEASWAEIAYRTSDAGRRARIEYLHRVHTAVTTNNFALVETRPFNVKREDFDSIKPSVVVLEDASFLTAQYGHYILGPLVMVALEGMLQSADGNVSVAGILKEIHETGESFFSVLERHIPETDIVRVKSWMFDNAPIPRELIEAGIGTYTVP